MPLPFDMLAVMLFLGWYAETPDANPPSPAHAMAVLGIATLVMLVLSALVCRITLRALRRRGGTLSRRRSITGNADLCLRVLLVGAYAGTLFESSLPWSLARAFGIAASPEAFWVQIFGLAPYILLFFAAWLPQYPLHRETNVGHWTRATFLVHKARYNLYMLLAWVPFAFLADWMGEFLILLPILFLGAAWAFPLVLARAWGCRRIREGEVLETVHALEDKAGVRFSRIYLWEPGGGNIQNAAAVGLMPPFRFLFLTPALIRNMKGPELESVILHELGHIKKKHLLFYLFTSLAGINSAVLFAALLPLASTERFLLTAALVLLYFRLVFGWLSRNMERQADLFALEKSGSAQGLANALEKLGISAGGIRLAASWHHLGIAERVDFLRRAQRNPEIAHSHNAGVTHIMRAGYLLSFVLLGGMVWLVGSEFAAERSAASSAAAATAAATATVTPHDLAHWRRVMRVLPENADAPLNLAYRLARKPGARDEAAALAGDALRLAGSNEAADAAKSLLRDLHKD